MVAKVDASHDQRDEPEIDAEANDQLQQVADVQDGLEPEEL
jgi:hypothetical protein